MVMLPLFIKTVGKSTSKKPRLSVTVNCVLLQKLEKLTCQTRGDVDCGCENSIPRHGNDILHVQFVRPLHVVTCGEVPVYVACQKVLGPTRVSTMEKAHPVRKHPTNVILNDVCVLCERKPMLTKVNQGSPQEASPRIVVVTQGFEVPV